MNKYIEFKEVPYKGKTQRFEVVSKSSGDILGRIQWYSQWRQYVFMPSYPTVWNSECLADIEIFLVELMVERKTELVFNKKILKSPMGKYK